MCFSCISASPRTRGEFVLYNYFAYGSNMSARRLQQRIPAEPLGVGTLSGFRLCFSKPSEADGSTKCDIKETANPDDVVYGVVYRINREDKPTLDEFEGLGYGYDAHTVTIEFRGKPLEVYTYKALNHDPLLKPFAWYKRHVLEGAMENNLPAAYINAIKEVKAVADSNAERRTRELSIYDPI